MDHTKIQVFLQNNIADWIKRKRNPPSHIGVYGSAKFFQPASLLQTHGQRLEEKSLQTLITKTEAVINSRPLTVETVNVGQGCKPLSPNNLLTTKLKVVMPPPGVFQRPNL